MIIELAKNYPDKIRFEKWLVKQGFELDKGRTDKSYVDLEDTAINNTARKLLEKLEKQFRQDKRLPQ